MEEALCACACMCFTVFPQTFCVCYCVMVHEVSSLSLRFAALESNDAYPSVEELIAKARAPVKREYLRQSGTRVLANTVVMTEETMAKLREEEGDDAEMMPSGNSIPKTSVEKKSKRQQRRDRKEVTSSWAP